jgi:hypothetical protein
MFTDSRDDDAENMLPVRHQRREETGPEARIGDSTIGEETGPDKKHPRRC